MLVVFGACRWVEGCVRLFLIRVLVLEIDCSQAFLVVVVCNICSRVPNATKSGVKKPWFWKQNCRSSKDLGAKTSRLEMECKKPHPH